MASTGKLQMPSQLLTTLTALETAVTNPYSPRSGTSSPQLSRSRTCSPDLKVGFSTPIPGRTCTTTEKPLPMMWMLVLARCMFRKDDNDMSQHLDALPAGRKLCECLSQQPPLSGGIL